LFTVKKILVGFGVSFFVAHAWAADLLPDGQLRDIKTGDAIQTTATVGGYPIFQNDGNWKFVSGKNSTSSGSDPVKMGSILMDYSFNGYLLARQNIFSNTSAGSNRSWGGSPCSPDHLVIRNMGKGMQDNCMTIDPVTINLVTTPTTFFKIALTNAGGGGRYYAVSLYLNADLLGFRNTGLGDWTQDQLKVVLARKEVIDKLTAWSEQIQDGSIKAFDYSKPQDVYNKIPALMTLLPVPPDLVGQKRSISFLSAVEHLRHFDSIKSIAYSRWEDYKGSWGFVTEQASQELADAAAVMKCETNRKSNRLEAPACEVYRNTDVKRVADTYEFKVTPKATSIAVPQ